MLCFSDVDFKQVKLICFPLKLTLPTWLTAGKGYGGTGLLVAITGYTFTFMPSSSSAVIWKPQMADKWSSAGKKWCQIPTQLWNGVKVFVFQDRHYRERDIIREGEIFRRDLSGRAQTWGGKVQGNHLCYFRNKIESQLPWLMRLYEYRRHKE